MSTKLSTELLRSFCGDKEPLNAIHNLWSPKLFSRDEENRLIESIGREAYEAQNWDTAVCDGSVMLCLPGWKHPEGKELSFGVSFPTRWFWCFNQITQQRDVIPLPEASLLRVCDSTRDRLAAVLPDVRWWQIQRVNFFTSSRGVQKAQSEPPPDNVIFFSFTGGCGVVAVAPITTGGGR